MGVVYRVFCEHCRTYMDVDKLDRRNEMKMAIAAFMLKHNRHDCILIDDGDDDAWGTKNSYYDRERTYSKEDGPDDN
jgi:hypothetical protein